MNHEQSVLARPVLLSGGVFGACFLLPCSWHVNPMLQEHQHLSMQTFPMPFALGSTACSHRILWWPEHLLECVFMWSSALAHSAGAEVWTGRAGFSAESCLRGPSPEGQLGGCSQLWNGDHLSPGLTAPLLCQYKQAKSLVKRISPHCRTSKSSC